MTEQSGLFWEAGTTTTMTEQEVAGWRSPEQTGERLVETVTAWLAHALEQLPAEWQGFRIDFERPDWIDPRTPEHALHELQRLMVQLPHAIPEKPPLEREQRRAVEVLMAARDTVEAVQGLAPARALVLIDNAINLGIAAARAHVEPWEVVAATGLRASKGRSRGGKSGVVFTSERRADFKAAWEEWVADGRPGKKRDFDEAAAARFFISTKTAEAERHRLEKSLTSTSQGDRE